MPFQSEKQRRYMWAKHPEIARRWTKEYGSKVHGGKKESSDQSEPGKEASMNFPERVVETLQISALALQKAEKEANEKTAAVQRYTTKIAAVVEKCVKCGRIDDTKDEREKLAAWLATPEGALEVIDKLAEHEVDPPATAALGHQVDAKGHPITNGTTKRASHDSMNNPYVGQRTGQEPESWRRLAAGLGIA